MKLILIGSLRRHGGSLLARLFDGHPDCYSLPIERYFSKPSRRRGDKLPKNHWPDLRGVASRRDIDELIELLDLSQYGLLSQSEKFANDDILFDVDEERLRTIYREKLEELEDWTREGLWMAEVEAFLRALNAGRYWTGPRSHIVNHCATSVFLPLDAYFSEFPSGRFIYLFRSPQAYYASIKGLAVRGGTRPPGDRWLVRGDDDYRALDLWTQRWIAGASAALRARLSWSDRMILVRYEDLLGNPEPSMRAMALATGLTFDPVLTKPSVLGQEWAGNSTFGPLAGLSDAPLQRWQHELTAREQARIAERAQGFLTALGYDSENSWTEVGDQQKIDWAEIAHRCGVRAGEPGLEETHYNNAGLSRLSRLFRSLRHG